jgi:hypothetical protein
MQDGILRRNEMLKYVFNFEDFVRFKFNSVGTDDRKCAFIKYTTGCEGFKFKLRQKLADLFEKFNALSHPVPFLSCPHICSMLNSE